MFLNCGAYNNKVDLIGNMKEKRGRKNMAEEAICCVALNYHGNFLIDFYLCYRRDTGRFFLFREYSLRMMKKVAARGNEEEESRTQAEIQTAMAVKATAVNNQDEEYIEGLSAYIRHVNRNVTEGEADQMAGNFVKYADQYGVGRRSSWLSPRTRAPTTATQ